jgi:hypothetical protein
MSVSPVGATGAFAYASTTAPRREAAAAVASTTGRAGLSEADLRVISALQTSDRVVHAHEMAHMAAGAGLVTRGASYTYQTGPDGQRYAVGGEVGIDVSPGRTPQESLAKAERIRAAALAPAEPSAQDLQVAASAAQMASEARLEISAGAASGTASRAEAAYAAAGADPQATSGAGSGVDVFA